MSDNLSLPSYSFPKNLSFSLKRMNSYINKSKLKINSDRSEYKSGQQIKFTLPRGAMIDFRSLVIYATGSTSAGTTQIHFPRNGLSSLIENLQVSINNQQINNIQAYNFLYNTLYDMECGREQETKRNISGEIADPSVKYDITSISASGNTTQEGIITAVEMSEQNNADANVPLVANNFLGALSSFSTPVLNTAYTGTIEILITLAPAVCCFQTGNTTTTALTAIPTSTSPEYTLTNVYLTIDKLTYTSGIYNRLLEERLADTSEEGGLKVCCYDYSTIIGSLFVKSAGNSLNASVNSKSLDLLIGTFRHERYNTLAPLLIKGTITTNADSTSKYNYVSNPVSLNSVITGASSTPFDDYRTIAGDSAFANSWYFQRAGVFIEGSQFSVNSVPLLGYRAPPIEIYNNTLQSLGFNNLDMSSGLEGGAVSLHHWTKFYFCDATSLENISQDAIPFVSGYDGENAGIVINWDVNFRTNCGTKVYPYVFCRHSRVMTLYAGRNLVIE